MGAVFAKSSWLARLCFCCMVLQKICCMVLLTTLSPATTRPSMLLSDLTSVTVLHRASSAAIMGRVGFRLCKWGKTVAYTMETPMRTMRTEKMTARVYWRPSQKASTKQEQGMMQSFAICSGTQKHSGLGRLCRSLQVSTHTPGRRPRG